MNSHRDEKNFGSLGSRMHSHRGRMGTTKVKRQV
jgi:hypothetical protein